jgi:dynein heavy chain 1
LFAILTNNPVCLFPQRDILRELSSTAAFCAPDTFSWLKHARFYADAGADLFISIADGRFLYGWEYLGMIDRLVYTNLTDRFISQSYNLDVA